MKAISSSMIYACFDMFVSHFYFMSYLISYTLYVQGLSFINESGF